MDFFEQLKEYQGIFNDIDGDGLFIRKYADNDPRKPREEVFECPISEESREEMRRTEMEVLRKRSSNFSQGVDISENMQRIDIELMNPSTEDWNYMPLPSKAEMIPLIASIESIGLLQPLILLKQEDGTYTILCGRSRYLALCYLYNKNPLDRFKYPMCFVLDAKKVDEHFIRALIIDSNFNYRKIPQHIFIRMILERHVILKNSKMFRSESNVARELATEFNMSESSVYNYLSLSNLSEEVMTLLFEKRISLRVAGAYARVNPEVQLMILNNIDFKDVNFYFKIEFITRGRNIKTLDDVLARIKSSKDIVPQNSVVHIKLNNGLLELFMEKLVEILKEAVSKYSLAIGNGSIARIFKVKYDKALMKYLAAMNYVDQNILNKLNGRTITDVYRR
ncbi:MAG: ParB N-terminal domain-containing protein [Oscillospiraceae bacterium]|nr:ParB N-terminal domain-containing protein [Oscillospiraceae bacterium]